MVQAIGEDRLTLLELLAINNVKFYPGERIYIGKDGSSKIESVLGRLNTEELRDDSKNNLSTVVKSMISFNEAKYLRYFNELQPLTPRLHALELIPGIGKIFMKQIINEREKKPFSSFEDLQNRIHIREPMNLIAKRIVDELMGQSRIKIFVGR